MSSAPGPARAPRRTWAQRLVLVVGCAMPVVCIAAAGGLAYTYSKVADIGRIDLGTALVDKTSSPSAPENFLIVGTDSAEGLDPNDPVVAGRPPGVRSDTIMILRVDPAATKASLLSLPRDLYVPIAGLGGSDRINSAIQGGPARLVATIRQDFGIPINHYIELNFLAFRKVIAAVDGVPIWFAHPVRDDKVGLDVAQTGCVTLDPEQALAFARSRAYEEQVDGRWRTDPTGDLGRVSRQQQLIKRVVQRAIDRGARNPVVADSLITAVVGAVHLDPTLTPADLLSLASRFSGFDADSLATYSVPTSSDNVRGASVLRLHAGAAEPVLNLFRDVQGALSPYVAVTVAVRNGNGASGGGAQTARDIRSLGYTVPDTSITDDLRGDRARTVVAYNADRRPEAQQLARQLVAGADLVPTAYPLLDSDLLVITGTDYAGVTQTPPPDAGPATGPSSVPATDATTNGTAVTTTSTTIGVVPLTPPDQSC